MKYLLLIIPILLLSGCRVTFDSSASCTSVDNDLIVQGQFGTRGVYIEEVTDGQLIGYQNNGIHVAHSACTAAKVQHNGTSSTYSWFQFGQPVEENTIHSIRFFTNSLGRLSSEAERLNKLGAWQQQFVENRRITRQVWLAQAPFNSVTASDNFNDNGIREVVVVSGEISKTKTFNANTRQYDCVWSNKGVITENKGCFNETATDQSVFGVRVDSDFYFQQLDSATVVYDTDQQNLIDDINRYF